MKFLRAVLHTLEKILALYYRIHDPADLPFFHLHLFFVWHCLIHTATTGRKDTADRLPCLQWRFLQHFKKSSFCISSFKLVYHKTDLLSRNPIFHNNILFFLRNKYNPLVWEIYTFNNPFVDLTFFHPFLLSILIYF